jgi:hypothetical protein
MSLEGSASFEKECSCIPVFTPVEVLSEMALPIIFVDG